MAVGLDDDREMLKELKKEITCPVCQGVYRRAKLLPCNHYYCEACIQNMAAVLSSGRPFVCPKCRHETTLPPGGAAGLQPAFFVERMKDSYDKAERKMAAVTEVVKSSIGLVTEMAEAEKTLVSEESEVDRQKEEVTKSIQGSFDTLKALLEQRRDEMVKKGDSLAREKKESLAAQKTDLQAAHEEAQDLVKFVERNIDKFSDRDLTKVQSQLRTKLREEKKRYWQISRDYSASRGNLFLSPEGGANAFGSVFLQLSPALVKFRVFEPQKLCTVADGWGIAVNSRDEIFVCSGGDGNRNVVKIAKDGGEKLGLIECDGFMDPRGVAIGPDDSIFVFDGGAGSLFKFCPNGNRLKTVPLPGYSNSLRIFDGQVFIISSSNFKIFDLDLNVLGEIPIEEGAYDAVKGPDEFFFLTVDGKLRVYRLDLPNTAEHLRTLTLPISGHEDMCYCIGTDNSGHVLVGDGEFDLYMFESSGDCVGRARLPESVGESVVSSDGLIYVVGVEHIWVLQHRIGY